MTTALPRYTQESDVQMRLGHTFLRYCGEACYVQGITGYTIHLMLTNETTKIVHVEDPLLDISSPPAGYGYDPSSSAACWVSRIALRQQKQGLENHVVKSFYEIEDFASNPITGLPTFRTVVGMINGTYPPKQDYPNLLYSRVFRSVPFARNYCFVKLRNATNTYGVKFMGVPIGLFNYPKNIILLSRKYRESPVEVELAKNFQIEVQDESEV